MAGFSPITYAISKKYTEETAAEFGALKGANCTIESIVHQNGQNVVTFKWINTAGESRTSQMIVEDGTPIYVWHSGDHYEFGDLTIYNADLYRCTNENSDVTFDPTKWEEIGSADGNYDIIDIASQLPPIFTAADRKMYYCISEDIFYLWNGERWVQVQQPKFQFATMPTPSAALEGQIRQYVGETTENYKQGYWYICVEEDNIYSWENINTQEYITVDSELSDISENPVQNKIVKQAIDAKQDDVGFSIVNGQICVTYLVEEEEP